MRRRAFFVFFKYTGEVVCVRKAALHCYLNDSEVGAFYHVDRFFNAPCQYVFLSRFSHNAFEEVTEIAFAHMRYVC